MFIFSTYEYIFKTKALSVNINTDLEMLKKILFYIHNLFTNVHRSLYNNIHNPAYCFSLRHLTKKICFEGILYIRKQT